jgi:hypothetical protein
MPHTQSMQAILQRKSWPNVPEQACACEGIPWNSVYSMYSQVATSINYSRASINRASINREFD